MTDHPIIFSAAMVRALLAGRKTQTRRLATSPLARCAVGDRLWVRETWRGRKRMNPYPPSKFTMDRSRIAYVADGPARDCLLGEWQWGKTRVSIHMPRWASRLTLIVEAVRVDPLQALGQADAIAEGCVRLKATGRGVFEQGDQYLGATWPTPRAWYADLWDSLHRTAGERWDDNPAVVVLTFRVVCDNIDQLRGGE